MTVAELVNALVDINGDMNKVRSWDVLVASDPEGNAYHHLGGVESSADRLRGNLRYGYRDVSPMHVELTLDGKGRPCVILFPGYRRT